MVIIPLEAFAITIQLVVPLRQRQLVVVTLQPVITPLVVGEIKLMLVDVLAEILLIAMPLMALGN